MEARYCLTAYQTGSQLLGSLCKSLCGLTLANLSHVFPPNSHIYGVWLSKWSSSLPPAPFVAAGPLWGVNPLPFPFFILKPSPFFTNPVHVTLWWILDLSPTRGHLCIPCSHMVHCCIFILALTHMLYRNFMYFSSPDLECKMLEKHCVPLALVSSKLLSTGSWLVGMLEKQVAEAAAIADYWGRERAEQSETHEPNGGHFGEES